jgi:SAM-dependent methyltransferase
MANPTNYDPIAGPYSASKKLPFRRIIEQFTLFEIVGPLRGLRVLDLACGDGVYSREARRRGAAAVVGVDLSAEMIRSAREHEQAHALGCEFLVGDARSLERIGVFDVVLGSYLLNYARDRGELLAILEGVARNLAPGGRFVGVNQNPFQVGNVVDYRRHGIAWECSTPLREGAPVTWTIQNPAGSSFTVENYYLPPEAHDEAFRLAGFAGFRWVPCRLDPAATLPDASYFADFLAAPPIIGIEAVRTEGQETV